MMALKKIESTRKTVAVLGAQLNRVWGGDFMAGVMDVAEKNDINLVCFAGGKPAALASPDSHEKENSYGLYDLVRPEQFDGILLAADVAHGVSSEEIKKFCRSFGNIPMTSFAVQADGVSSFVTDSEDGMRAIIRHLIEVHGCQKIAFVRGIRGQAVAEQRFRAYKDEF
jgi:sigma-B regulation protein RsbU (phosphoserine phosphatase)